MDTIKVLWVDDQNFEQIENIAEHYGIDITHVYSWEEAKPYLQGFRFDDWSAIILDCYCKMYPNGPDDRKFLRKVFDQLSTFSEGRLLPWYVLSGGTDQGFLSIIDNQLSEDREIWDSNWEKVYYSKLSGDYKDLLKNIQSMAPQLPNYKVRHRFKDVFSMIEIEKLFSPQLGDIMFPILKALYYPETINSVSLVSYYNQLRKAAECLFRSCHKMGLLPDEFVETKHGVNLSLSSHYLAGNRANCQDGYFRYGEEGDRVFPESIAKIIKDVLSIANTQSHTVDLNDEEKKQIEDYFSDYNSGQYVIFSMAMGLCSVFVWYKQFMMTHSDIDENKSKCRFVQLNDEIQHGSNSKNDLIEKNETTDEADRGSSNLCMDDFEGKTMPLEIDVIDRVDVAHCGLCALRGDKAKFIPAGTLVRLYDVKKNNFLESMKVFPYSAKYNKV